MSTDAVATTIKRAQRTHPLLGGTRQGALNHLAIRRTYFDLRHGSSLLAQQHDRIDRQRALRWNPRGEQPQH
jgi:hypothetical protein